MKVRNARKSKSKKVLTILVSKGQAMKLGEDFSDVGCPFAMSAAKRGAAKGRKRKAGRKK
jgi:hypothetical protein